jgi:hypothetical protein
MAVELNAAPFDAFDDCFVQFVEGCRKCVQSRENMLREKSFLFNVRDHKDGDITFPRNMGHSSATHCRNSDKTVNCVLSLFNVCVCSCRLSPISFFFDIL